MKRQRIVKTVSRQPSRTREQWFPICIKITGAEKKALRWMKRKWFEDDTGIECVVAWLVALGLQHPGHTKALLERNERYCLAEGLKQNQFALAEIAARPEYRQAMRKLER